MSEIVLGAVAGFAGFALALHLATHALVYRRLARPLPPAPSQHPALSVLRPVCGLEPGLAKTLATTFTKRSGNYEVIFCVASDADPAIPTLRALMADHPQVPTRLLIGNDVISGNPKLNNLEKGWQAAAFDWVVMIDSNVELPGDYIQQLFASWGPDTGLVTSPPAGTQPQGIWASVEAGFLNGYQGRWQLTSDELGNGFAQGKVLMWQKALLNNAGGLAALGDDLAEDVASTKVVRAAGLKVQVLPRPLPQPLGHRTMAEVWLRQLRWARVRRAGFPLIFASEILSGPLLPFIAVALLCEAGWLPDAAWFVFAVLWYGVEWLLAKRAGWPGDALQLGAWVLRDLMIPAVWATAYAARGFVWRGTSMAQDEPQSLQPNKPLRAHPAQ